MSPTQLLKVKEVADVLRVSYRTVLDEIHLGRLLAYKIKSEYRISERELSRYLSSNKVHK